MYGAHDVLTRWPQLDVTGKRARLQESLQLTPGPLGDVITASVAAAERAAGALWLREPSAWSEDAAVQQKIAARLGWMSSPMLMADSIDRLLGFAASAKEHAFTDVVLLGMGGSSLAPEVLRATLGVAPGYPRFQVLDSTDPAAVRAAATPPGTTLYLVSSKSGTTIEPNSLAAHFRERLVSEVSDTSDTGGWANHFVAITDEGTELAERARAERFRDVFINPSDIGGRYSALSFFGMVPAALMGLDVAAIVGWGLGMLAAAEPGFGTALNNPATALGLAMGAGARAGRDKLTLLLPDRLAAFGLWVEQLIAESTGKNGTGVVPIAGEHPSTPAAYGSDRVFVRVNGPKGALANAASVDLQMPEPEAIGAEFVRWEVATAVAGALLGINPFDEPNVQQAKDATRTLLGQFQQTGKLPRPAAAETIDGGIEIAASDMARKYLGQASADGILTLLRRGDYCALLAYLGPDPALQEALQALRNAVVDATGAATMFGYGPRYLHSTGQLHKGGPNTGVFALITATPREDVAIPGETFSFGTLELAQALGDFASLDATGRRAIHVHLPAPDAALIKRLSTTLLSHVDRSS
jgi:glucose-6-phosphate isomerase